MRESIALFMSNVHKSVNEMSQVYLTNERRYNYTTPKSFLEQIKLYQNLLQAKFDELHAKTVRLENGLEKLKSTSAQVSSVLNCMVLKFEELKVRQFFSRKNKVKNSSGSAVFQNSRWILRS